MKKRAGEPTISKEILQKYIERGLTTPEMADTFDEEYGVRKTDAAFGVAMARYGLKSARPSRKYADVIPWRVRSEHSMRYDVRMLRAYARTQKGGKLPEPEKYRLERWLQTMIEDDLVIVYEPDTEQGFFRVRRQETDNPDSFTRVTE